MAKRYQGVLPFWQGVTITSTDGGRHNKGSKHYTGDAIDIDHITGRKKYGSFENAAALFSKQYPDWRLVNEEVKNNPAWTGPHWHAEYIGGGQPKQNTFTALSGNQKPMMQNPFTPQEYKPQAFKPLQINMANNQAPVPPGIVADAEDVKQALLNGDHTLQPFNDAMQADMQANAKRQQQIDAAIAQAQALNHSPSIGRTLLGALLGGGVGLLGSALSGENIGTGFLMGAGGGAAGAFAGQQNRQANAQNLLPLLFEQSAGLSTSNSTNQKNYMDAAKQKQDYQKGRSSTDLYNWEAKRLGRDNDLIPNHIILSEDQGNNLATSRWGQDSLPVMASNMSQVGTQLLNQARGAATSPIELQPLPMGTPAAQVKSYTDNVTKLLGYDTSSPTSVGAGIREADMKTPIEVAKVNTDILRANNDAQNNQASLKLRQMLLAQQQAEASMPKTLYERVAALRAAGKNAEADSIIKAYQEMQPVMGGFGMPAPVNTSTGGSIINELTKGLQ